MENDYWSIDAIFAENQKLDCTFLLEVPNLGYIDGGDMPNIPAQTKMRLPYWLAAPLLVHDYLEFRIPPAVGYSVLKALSAEPRSVKLSSLVGGGGSWYKFGKEISELLEEATSKDLTEALPKTFRARLVDLIDQAQHFDGTAGSTSASGTGNEFREGLESTEREIFALAQNSAHLMKTWHESSDKR
ncbi:hypothetical protein BS47DRAFT_1323888 [Hydnum rufescens UP504]|uniref:DNA replication complex GINS protein PSF3 n=1 Tax=Hydnum rufescens UP504 TaxID=1448309 RepID=A0A9P6BCS9_9AGAM|nr:hypothetical protein BS47DRAFT_1323888 [Hydnum rufescens UP504]